MPDGLLESAQSLARQGENALDQAATRVLRGDFPLASNMAGLLLADDLVALGGKLVGLQRQTEGRLLDLLG